MSPMKDFGYDVSNFVDIDPVFGKLQDIDELIESAHAKGNCFQINKESMKKLFKPEL